MRPPCDRGGTPLGHLWPPPSLGQTRVAASAHRAKLWVESLEISRALGPPSDKVTSRESDLRDFVHDALHPHHDKHVRSLAFFPGPASGANDLAVWVLEYTGKVRCLRITNGEDL